MRMQRCTSLLLGILTAVAAAGCSSYRPPSVTVLEARIDEVTDEAALLQVTMRLENPNDEPLEILAYTYGVSVEGDEAFRGRRAGMATLAPRGQTEARLPAVVRFEPGVPRDLESVPWTITGRVHYLTPGELAEILLDTGVRRPKHRFTGRGVVQPAPEAGS